MHWDHEVDLVSVGSGAGGLAAAIAAADAGQTVFVAQLAPRGPQYGHPPGAPSRRLRIEVADAQTSAYLDAVTEILPGRPHARPVDVPVRVVRDAKPLAHGCNPRRNTVASFVGARLGQWTAECLAASHCAVYSQVTDRNMTAMRSEDGDKFEAAVVGSLSPGVPHDGRAIADWLADQARSRAVDVHPAAALDRLVFEDGRVVGAVVRTQDGTCAVAARRGLVVSTGGLPGPVDGDRLSAPTPVQVCLVSRIAGRFARLELLARPRVTGRAPASSAPRSQRLNSRARCHPVWPGQLHDDGAEL